jgi:hypothetical protein
MAPSKVDPNKKQAKSLNNQVEEETFYLDRMYRSVNHFPSQAMVDNVKKQPRALFYECLDDGEKQQIQIPTLFYLINMRERFAAVRATIRE